MLPRRGAFLWCDSDLIGDNVSRVVALRATIAVWTGGRPTLGRAESLTSTPGIDAAANAAPLRESRTRGTAPTRPRPWSADPEQAIRGAQHGPTDRSFVHGDLMT